MKPGEVDLGLGPDAAPDDDAGITGESHEEVAGVTHPAGKNHGRRPVRWGHLVRRNDAEHEAFRLNRALGGDPGCGTAAAAHDGDAEFGEGLTRQSGKFICWRAGIGTA